MEQIIDWDSLVDDALFGFMEQIIDCDSTILTFPPPPPCGISSSLHSSPERHYSSSELYIHELPQPPFEQTPFIVDPNFDPALFDEFEAPQPPSMPMVAPVAKGSNGLNAQSMAARERRKRISEKTLDLGRLIPGGNRMNTAEMFQAAFKYLKFLQAQHGVLQLLGSFPVPVCKSVEDGHLHLLLDSTVVQEKLSAMGMCMLPKEIADELSAEGICIVPKEIVDEFVVSPQIKSRRLGS